MSKPQVGFASFKDRSVELIFRDADTCEEVALDVKGVSAEDRAALSRILATCVFVNVKPLSTLDAAERRGEERVLRWIASQGFVGIPWWYRKARRARGGKR